jgi:Domain of unknown function (DUF4335)
MESNHLTTRTYTAPTCTLLVSSKAVARSRNSEQLANPVDFILELESELGLDRITIPGHPHQLDALHHSVNTYVAELVAKFPTLTIDLSAPADRSTGAIDPMSPQPSNRIDPRDNRQSPRSEIIRNLPGLRGNLPPSPAADFDDTKFDDTKPSISNLFSRWRKPNRPNPLTADRSDPNPIAHVEERSEQSPTTPYLTGASQRSLDHYLFLGDLATPTSGDRLTLSAIQLFDLAAVLDEYAAMHVTNLDRSNILSRAPIRDANRLQNTNPSDATRSHLPNLPRIPTQQPTQVGQAYHRAPRRSSSFMSGIPWAVAAAIAVGVPLLLLDPNPNPLKDAANKVKIPNLAGSTKKTTVATVPGATPTQSAPNNPITGLPTPWQQQPVQPPVNTKPLDAPKISTPQDSGKLDTAPLPDAIVGTGQVPTTSGNLNPAIAPNPLTSQVPGAIDSGTTTTTTTSTSPVKPTRIVKTPTGTSQTTPKIGQLPIDAGTSNKVSLSNQPMLVPPAGQPIVSTPTTTPIPFNRSGLDQVGRIDPATRSNPKKTVPKVKPSPSTKPKQTFVQPTPASVTPKPFEPLTPVPTNPNLIDPNQNNPESTEEPTPVVPNQPLQSNAGGFGNDSVEAPSLQETKRYFQSKWKATNTQPNALQYVLQVSGKSGTVQSVTPQGAAAATYLQQTKFIKAGQKLVSPAAAGSSDQKIRVLLQPDGNVDTFIEP